MKCDRCGFSKLDSGLDQCFCEPEKAISGGEKVEWLYYNNVWARIILPDGYKRLPDGYVVEYDDLCLDCGPIVGGYLERNHGDLLDKDPGGPKVVVDIPSEVFCDEWLCVDDNCPAEVPTYEEDDSFIYIRKVVKK